jgi:NTP pyrophosphatase (non-canonical NTP hydrolase)
MTDTTNALPAVIDISSLQAIVYAAVEARGYTDGWRPEQFAARQAAKLQEEVSEYADFCHLPPRLATDITVAGQHARTVFDIERQWDKTGCFDRDAACKELADIVVVALCAAESLHFDVLEAALNKATGDIVRGKRNGND